MRPESLEDSQVCHAPGDRNLALGRVGGPSAATALFFGGRRVSHPAALKRPVARSAAPVLFLRPPGAQESAPQAPLKAHPFQGAAGPTLSRGSPGLPPPPGAEGAARDPERKGPSLGPNAGGVSLDRRRLGTTAAGEIR